VAEPSGVDRYIDYWLTDVRKYADLSPSGTAGNNWPEVRLAGGNGSEDDASGRMERGGGSDWRGERIDGERVVLGQVCCE